MGSFTVHCDFNQLDGGVSLTKNVTISSNVQVTTPDVGIIYDSATVALADGVLQVELPANDNDPGDFGFVIRRATGLTKTWRVPAQDPGAFVELTSFTATTALPLPPSGNAVSQTEFEAYQTSNDSAVGTKVNSSTYTAGQATQDAALATETSRAQAAEAAAVTTAATDATTKVAAETTRATAAEALKAPLASPTFTGTVSGVSKAMVGLGSADNTSDANKPVSTAQAAADAAIGTAAATDATAKVATETTRATAAEGANTTAIAGEATTARAAELALRNLTDQTLVANLAPRVTRPPAASEVTKGIYARTQPLPDVGTALRPMVKDPNQSGVNGTGRLWGVGAAFAQICFTDDDGATRTIKASPFTAGLSVQQMVFSTNYLWCVVASTSNKSGEVWRVPLPNNLGNPGGAGTNASANLWGTTITAASNGASLPQATINFANGNYFPSSGTVTVFTAAGPQLVTYTGKTAGTLTGCTGGTGAMATGGSVTNAVRVFALNGGVNGPGGATGDGGVNSTFRNSCFAIDAAETHAYVGEYGAADTAYQFTAVTDGIMAAGSGLLYSATLDASAQMAGLSLVVAGADVGGADLTATVLEVIAIKGIAQSACLRLTKPARTAVTAATVTFPSTTYGSGNIPGGPTVYHCANPTAAPGSVTWTAAKQFKQGKHIHSVKIIGGLPWVGIGDLSKQFPDCGLWVATSLASPTVWNQRTIAPAGGVAKDPINGVTATVSGQSVTLWESDSSFRDGPLMFANATGTVNRVLDRSCTIPQPYSQTMRQLGLDPTTGNVYWFGTGETGSVGPTSCIWMSRAPYTVPVLLEDVGAALDTATTGDAVISNGYFWISTFRCAIEKFADQ